MGEPNTAGSFENYETWNTLSTKVARALYETAGIEFSTILGGADVERDEIRDIRRQAEVIKSFVCAYVDGLAELYCVFGCRFSGDASAQKELDAEFGGKGKKRWEGAGRMRKPKMDFLDWLADGPLGAWVEKHGAPPRWITLVCLALSVLLSILSILLSAGAFAR